jgi:hypothetical protein
LGVGGVGVSSSITGSATFYAGGGAGAGATNSWVGGNGGGGGLSPGSGVQNGAANTGGGGAGERFAGSPSGNGGSGVVIVRYPDTLPAPLATTGSPVVTTAGGFRIFRFTGSGSITLP